MQRPTSPAAANGVVRLTAVLLGVSVISAAAADSGRSTEAGQVAKLVRQLGDSSFQTRRTATRRLLEIGLPALAALKRATGDDDLEVRYRARRLYRKVRLQVHSRRLDQYAADPESLPVDRLSGLKQYREMIGDDPAARRMFVAMQRAEAELFVLLGDGDQRLDERFNSRSLRIRYLLTTDEARKGLPATASALLFLAALPEVTVTDQAASSLYSLVNYGEFKQALKAQPEPSPARRIIGHWVTDDESGTAQQRLLLALRHNLHEGLAAALTTLKAPANPYELQFALLAVGRFGTRSDLPAVEKRFRDKTLLTRIGGGKNKVKFTSQVRDVALAVAAHLTGQNAKKTYGFARLSRSTTYLYNPNTAGFASDDDRAQAFEKWAKWKSANGTAKAKKGNVPAKEAPHESASDGE